MKNNKILTFILTFMFAFVSVFAMFPSTSAEASTINITDEDYNNSLNVLKAVCPEFPLEGDEITTRAQFVGAVAMMLNMPMSVPSSAPYRDVPAEHEFASAVLYAKSMGLISNVDMFYPDSPVTYAQAIKIVMSAAGYGKMAEFTGGFPTGYLRVANDAGVGNGLSLGNEDTISHEIATRLIFEGCIIDMMEVTSFGESFDYTVTEGKNILSLYHKIYMAEGIVEANQYTGLRSIGAASADGFVTIDDINYKGYGFENLIGKRARVFCGDDTRNTIICAYESENEIITYTDRDRLSISGNTLKAEPFDLKDDKEYKLASDYTLIYNGKCYSTVDYSSVINPSSGTVALISNDGDNVIDVIVVKETDYGIVGSVNAIDEKIYDKYEKKGVINLALSGVHYFVREADGTPLELEDLEAGDTLGYVVSTDKKLYEIIRYSNKVGGVIGSVIDGTVICMGENEYKLSSYFTTNVKALSAVKLGTDVILHLGEGSSVIFVEEFTSDICYGFFVAAGETPGLSGSKIAKIFGQDGVMHEYELADKVRVDDGIGKSAADAYAIMEAIESKDILMRVVKYSLNSEGKLNKLYQTVENTKGSKVFLTRTADDAAPVLYDDNTKHGITAANGKLVFKNDAFYPYFTMNSDCIILRVPKNESSRHEEKHYELLASTDMKSQASSNGDAVECYGYDVDMDGVSFLLWPSDSGGSTSVYTESANAIVESVSRGISPDGSDAYVVKLFADGKAEKYYSTTDTESTVATLMPGDIIQISANMDKEITAVNVNFIYSSKTVSGNATSVQGYNSAAVGFATGYFLNFSGKTGMIVRNKTIEQIAAIAEGPDSQYFALTDMFPANLGRGKVYFVRFTRNRQTNAIEEAIVHTESDTSSIESYYTSGIDADYMVQRARYHDVSYTVVYVN